MIYLFSVKNDSKITHHHFFCDGIIYIHDINYDVYLYDSDYENINNAKQLCEKFEYELPESLNTSYYRNISYYPVRSYIKDIDKYIEINILNSI